MSREMVEKPGGAGKASRSEDHTAVKLPVESAHQLSTDHWFQVAMVLTTGVNSAFVLGYPGAVMVPLGWAAGAVGLILATLASLHANMLVAKLHDHGGKRNIRYRDVAAAVYGPRAYSITWALQYINLYLINIGYIILAGHSLKATYHIFRADSEMKLPYFIGIAGAACCVFAMAVPHLSAMRIWLGFSTLFGLLFIGIGVGLSIKDGRKAPPRDYTIPGAKTDRIFSTISASANLVFSFNTGMLPEIQATVRQPMIANTMKALYFQFTAGVLPMYCIIFGGYWAYGNATDDYLLNNVHGSATLRALANLAAFLQSVIALHIFASPMYEYLDTRFDIVGPALKARNLTFRIVVRGGYVAVTAFVGAMLPFIDDFMSLTGAFSTFPLTFILAHHMYITAKGDKLSVNQKRWHWANVAFFATLATATAISSIRSISKDSKNFSVFADM